MKPSSRSPLPSSTALRKKKGLSIGIFSKSLLKTCIAGLITLGIVWLCLSETSRQIYAKTTSKIHDFSARHGLALQTIHIEGNFHTPKQIILKTLNIKLGSSLLSYDPKEIQSLAEKLPWIRSAKVQRVFPDTLLIKMAEKFPIAIWQQDQKLTLVDDAGKLISRVNASNFSYLPIIIGKGAPEKAPELFATLSALPNLHKDLSAAILVSERRWDLILHKTIRVKLPEKDISQSLSKLSKIEQDTHLSMNDILSIDLRIPDRLYIHLKKEAAAARRSSTSKSRV